MKNYPEGNNFWWTVGEMLAIICVYFTLQFAISAESIAWMLNGEAESLPLQNEDGSSITSGKDSASPLWRAAR